MAGNGNAAAELGGILLRDYLDNGGNSAVCRYLEFVEPIPGPYSTQMRIARRLFCPPPDPPPPPPEDFFNAGGVPCRLYRVIYESGIVGQAPTPTQLDRRGPIGRIQREINQPDGKVGRVITLTSGTGIGCPRVFDQMAGTNDVSVNNVFARIISIIPLEGTPETEIPVYGPPLEGPPNPPQPFNFEIDLNIDGIEVNAPFTFGPTIGTNFGPVIPFTFSPTANFNPNIDITLGGNPQFGVDLNFEFVIPLGGPPAAPQPLPGAEPVPLPNPPTPQPTPCPEFDYERIEDKIEAESCCKEPNDSQSLGSFTFDDPNDVWRIALPSGTLFVELDITPDNNSRRWKLAGDDSEISLGNAAITSDGHALGYEKMFVRRHILEVPPNVPNPGLRVSLKQNCSVQARALIYAVQ